VGVRCPSHPLALRLLSLCGVPVAAPSANKFGHVSPTSARHVLADLGEEPVYVLDGEDRKEAFAVPPCQLGIESTVVKVVERAGGGGELVVLRQGAVAAREIERAAAKCGGGGGAPQWTARVESNHARFNPPDAGPPEEEAQPPRKRRKQSGGGGRPDENHQDENQSAPGQLLTHYAPAGLECSLVRLPGESAGGGGPGHDVSRRTAAELLAEPAVVVDYQGRLAEAGINGTHPGVVGYKNLGADPRAAARGLFAALRWAEGVPGGRRVLLRDLGGEEGGEGVNDRMYRAASGKVVYLD
jgi:hypothetical protein